MYQPTFFNTSTAPIPLSFVQPTTSLDINTYTSPMASFCSVVQLSTSMRFDPFKKIR